MKNNRIQVLEITISMAAEYNKIVPFLNEKSKRLKCAAEAQSYWYGRLKIVHQATKISYPKIIKVMKELRLN